MMTFSFLWVDLIISTILCIIIWYLNLVHVTFITNKMELDISHNKPYIGVAERFKTSEIRKF